MRTLVGMEETAWRAVVEGRARTHFAEVLAPDAVVVGLGGSVQAGEGALDALASQTWSWFRVRGPRLVPLGEAAAAVTYRLIIRRDFDTEHHALVTSTYRRPADGEGWELVVVHHTPV